MVLKNGLMVLAFSILSMVGLTAQASWDGKVIEAATRTRVSMFQMGKIASEYKLVVMGEKHYTPEVQAMEGEVIRTVVSQAQANSRFTVAWEFLNASDQTQTESLFSEVMKGNLTPEDFLTHTQGSPSAAVYAPVIAATRDLQGELLGINLSRDEKRPVTKGGIQAADPALVPPGFALLGSNYRARFDDVMSGHVPPDKLQNYYEAQCLTDDVMAYNALTRPSFPLVFVIAGSFHTDYFDGTLGRLAARGAGNQALSVKIVDASDYSETELLDLLNDPDYGLIADYVIYVNEPRP